MSLTIEAPPVPLRIDEHGVMRVGQTRVRLDTVITAWKQGASPEGIVDSFDTLDLVDVYAVITYYLHHREEVDNYMEQNRIEGERIREKMEKLFPPEGIRARLLARRAARESEQG